MTSRVITFGTFDIFHIGHHNILERARALGGHLTVGISSDDLNRQKKGRTPFFPLRERMQIIAGLKCVDAVFVEHSLDRKREYLVAYRAQVLVMGDDWKGRFDEYSDICDVRYLPRTDGISTTDLIERINDTMLSNLAEQRTTIG
jgi:choline-phosphate cytidylyltransferase